MTHHDHSKVEVDELGVVTAGVCVNGNALNRPWTAADCPAYGRYIDRRVSHPNEDPRASARWANDWPASGLTGYVLDASGSAPYKTGGTVMRPAGVTSNPAKGTAMEGCMYIVGKDGKLHEAGSDGAKAALAGYMPPTVRVPFATTLGKLHDDNGNPTWTASDPATTTSSGVRHVESAQDAYPPVYDRPTFVLCVVIAALAGMLVGLIAGAWVMA